MGVKTIGNLSLDDLIASGRTALHTKTVKIGAGSGELKRGQLIGKSATGAYGAILSGDTPYGILCEDITLGSGDVDAMVYVAGHFNGNKVIGYTAEHYDELRANGIFIDNAFEY